MKACVIILTAVLAITISLQRASADALAPADFGPLTTLIGSWQGTSSDGKTVQVEYHLTSGGSSLLETIRMSGKPDMTTMYHLDRGRLMLTHYCSMGNQPRMSAEMPKASAKTVNFNFVDATNLASPSDPHMHRVTFTFVDQDHVNQDWYLSKEGKETPHTFTLERKK
jgi:hypothetical protein